MRPFMQVSLSSLSVIQGLPSGGERGNSNYTDHVLPNHPVGRQEWSLGFKVLVVGELMMMQ